METRQGMQGHENQRDPNERMRWVFLTFIIIWLLATITLTVIVYCLTKNTLVFSRFGTLAPPIYILYHITKYLFPRDEKDF